MGRFKLLLNSLIYILLTQQCYLQSVFDKIELRKELNVVAQEFLIKQDPFYHSYVFNSGIGNREEVNIDSLKKENNFTAGKEVLAWQNIQNGGNVYLLGRGSNSISLIVSKLQQNFNRTANFSEHTLELGVKVSSTSIFTRTKSTKTEVIAVVATENSTFDIIFFKASSTGKLDQISEPWTYCKKINSLSVINIKETNQLVVVSSGSLSSIDMFEIQFKAESKQVDFRSMQHLSVNGSCSSVTVCKVHQQLYLLLVQPELHTVAVYSLVHLSWQHQQSLSLPRVTQLVTFTVASQVYIAVNGRGPQVLRLSMSGVFVQELQLDNVEEWLAVTLESYRRDIVLFAKIGNEIKSYIWAGSNLGFISHKGPQGGRDWLEGDWSGAVPVSFWDRNAVLIPGQSKLGSNLFIIEHSLHPKANPVKEKLLGVVQSIHLFQKTLEDLKRNLSEAENDLSDVVKPNSVITAKWQLNKLDTQMLSLNTMVQPKAETEQDQVEAEREHVDMLSLETVVSNIIHSVDVLKTEAEEKEKKLWSIQNFEGKITFNKLIVDNLTVSQLNNLPVNSFLQYIFRKDKPRPIKGQVVVESANIQHLLIKQLNNNSADVLKFNDGNVNLDGNITFSNPVTIKNNLNLTNGGQINHINLAKYLCGEENLCSVSPLENEDESENMVKRSNYDFENIHWKTVYGGNNLKINKINGVDWDLLVKNLVFLDTQQNISGILIINGTLSSDLSIWTGDIYNKQHPNETEEASESRQAVKVAAPNPQDQTKPTRDVLNTNPNTVTVLTDLEVTGNIICSECDWGTSTDNVMNTNVDPVVMVNAGVDNVDFKEASSSHDHSHTLRLDSSAESGVLEVNSVHVLETLNGINISELVTTDIHGVTEVKQLRAHTINVADSINVKGKLCNQDLDDFEKRRLSIQKDQDISGSISAEVVNIKNGFINTINEKETSSYLKIIDVNTKETINITEIYVSENITTVHGINGHLLSEIANNAVKLGSNNNIKNMIFKDTVVFDILDCQGYLNRKPCQDWFNDTDIVSKNAISVNFSGKKKFSNTLSIAENLKGDELNGHKLEDLLTKHSEQDIKGDMFVIGDVEVTDNSILTGLFNNHNLTNFGNKCILEKHTIKCRGNAEFNGEVNLNNFHPSGEINSLKLEELVKSLVDREDPESLTVFMNFTHKSIHVKDLYVQTINNQSWKEFVADAVMQKGYELINSDVTFTNPVKIDTLNVDKNLDSSTVNNVDVSLWGSSAIYINDNFNLTRPLHLASASSLGNLTVVMYDDVNMLDMDLVKLRGHAMMSSPHFKSVLVTSDVNIVKTVNGHQLSQLDNNMLKVSGTQTVWSNIDVGEVFVSGNVTTIGPVNMQNLQQVVTLSTDQTLHGKYQLACVEAEEDMQVAGTVSGVNMSEWADSAVQKDRNQVLWGQWTVRGEMRVRAAVSGPGKLADIDLHQLDTNVTRQIVHVHQKMKTQLSTECQDTNKLLSLARNQTTKLLYMEVTQEISVPLGPSFVSHFKSGIDDYLAVCERGCLTIVYKWSRIIGQFTELHSGVFDSSIQKLVTLEHNQLTYLITDSSKLNCQYSGKHVWLFRENKIKHVTSLEFGASGSFEVYDNELYVMNHTGLYILRLEEESDAVIFTPQALNVHYGIDMWLVPNTAGLGLAVENEQLFVSLDPNLNLRRDMFDNCTRETRSFAVNPTREFIAIAATERTQVPKYTDHVKIYHLEGSLFDKVPASNASHLQWISVPGQTWLLFVQNMTSLQLYQLEDETAGFKLRISTKMELKDLKSASLPLKSKVNLQPFLIVQTDSAIKIVQMVLEGDPLMHPDLFCNFDDALKTIPGVL